MLRFVYVTAIVVGLALAGFATPSFAERARGTVLERTPHTLTVLNSDGRTHVFKRANDFRVGGEADRWRDIRRGDSVKIRFNQNHKYRFAERINVVAGPLYKTHPDQRRVIGEVTRVGRNGFEIVTRNGKHLKLRTAGNTIAFNTTRRPLRDCDQVEVVLQPRRGKGARKALQVRRLDPAPERYARSSQLDRYDRYDRIDWLGRSDQRGPDRVAARERGDRNRRR